MSGNSHLTPDDLSDAMEFDCPIRVHADGSVTRWKGDSYVPDLFEGELVLDSDEWELLDGYSAQDRYAGPIMHDSEYIGGAMARHILATPGVYVALPCYWADHDDEDGCLDIEGWAVAKLRNDGSD